MPKAKDRPPEWFCGADKGDGTTCRNRAGYKTDHVGTGTCHLHLGNTQTHRRAAQVQIARELAATYGDPVEGDPFDIIIAEIARTNGHVLWLADVIQSMEPEALTWGKTEESESSSVIAGDSVKYAAGVNVWLQLYREERTHLVKVCKEAIGVGIAERQVRLAEQTGQILAQVMRATLADPELGLTAAAQEAGLRVVSRHLRALPAA